MKILICEDDFMISKTIEQKLLKDGYEVFICNDGVKASKKLSEENFDLLITDLLMPFMSGLELLVYVRNELQSNMPVIVLTRLGNEESVVEAFNLGANDYLTKPFNPIELSIRVKKLFMN